MENLTIKATDDTPEVSFDTSGVMILSGRSLPEDAASFYNPLLQWLSDYGKSGVTNPVVFDMKLEYFNTASSKMLLDLFNELESVAKSGVDALVRWYYPEGDDDMQEAGEEYAELVEIRFEMLTY
ncbi:MAG: DUF1987 domain-containing protein [Sediminibacterium sp.]|nr:DUF1987 domain-containing protein [Sediminibacterium sp.]